MNPGDFRFTDAAGVDQLARILRAAIAQARREKTSRGGQHAAPALDRGDS